MQHTFLHPTCQYLPNLVKFTKHSTEVTNLWHIYFPWRAQIWHEHWAHICPTRTAVVQFMWKSGSMCYGRERQRLTLMDPKNLLQQNFTKMTTCAQTLRFLFYLSAYTEGCQSLSVLFSYVHVCNSDRPIWVKV